MRFKPLLIALTIATGLTINTGAIAANAAAPGGTTEAPAATTTIAIAPATTLDPQARQVLINRVVTQIIKAHHYPQKPLDDELARAVLKQYLEALDPAHVYFTRPEIDRFMDKYADELASDLQRGNLEPAFNIYNTFIDEAHEQLRYALSLLDKHYRFQSHEKFRFSRRHAPWAPSEKALDTLWRHRVANDLLSLILDGKTQKEAKHTLVKRYRYALNHINRTTSNDVFETWMNALAHVEDPHSAYFSPFDAQQFKIQMSLQLEGIGAQLSKHGNYITIVRILPGGPAAESQALDAGDRIIAVGQGKNGEMVNVIGFRLDDVVKLIRGPKGSTVRLKILPAGALPGGSSHILSLVRDTIELNAERASAKIKTLRRKGAAYRIGIITIPSFYVNFQAESDGQKHYISVSQDVHDLIEKMKDKGIDGILLDLRNNGGGSLSEALALSGLFIEGGRPVVQVRERRGDRLVVKVLDTPNDGGPIWTGPLALLVNRFSASATEIFTAAMKDYQRALILGSRTWGKGTVQQLVKLNRYLPGFRAGELKLTTAQFFRVTGSSTQHRGVKPRIVIPNAINDKKFGESTLPNALPWKHIPAADYKPVDTPIIELLPKLRNYYTASLKDKPGFKLYLKAIKQKRQQSARTKISLNMEKRKQLRASQRAQRLARINAWRRLKGEPTFDSLKAARSSDFTRPDVPLKVSTRLLVYYMSKAVPRVARNVAASTRPASEVPPPKLCLTFENSPRGYGLVDVHGCQSGDATGEVTKTPPASSADQEPRP